MSERVETFIRLCRVAIVEIAYPAQLERYLRAAVAEEFPLLVFTVGESVPTQPQALLRFLQQIIHGVSYAPDQLGSGYSERSAKSTQRGSHPSVVGVQVSAGDPTEQVRSTVDKVLTIVQSSQPILRVQIEARRV